MSQQPRVLFVCPHNANRSQIAAGYAEHLAAGRVRVASAGPSPAEGLNPVAVQAMAEDGIDISHVQPALLTDQTVEDADVIITLGCAAAVPAVDGKRFEDWTLTDPAGRDLDSLRPLRDEIKHRVEGLLAVMPRHVGRDRATTRSDVVDE
jgi:arsenate reductase (thioredoxin)